MRISKSGETWPYFPSPILFSPILLLKKRPSFPASPSTATPSVTQNPSSENKEKKALFQNLMRTFPQGKTHKNKLLLIYIQTSLFFLPPRHPYLSYRIFSAVGELSQNPFYNTWQGKPEESQKVLNQNLTYCTVPNE